MSGAATSVNAEFPATVDSGGILVNPTPETLNAFIDHLEIHGIPEGGVRVLGDRNILDESLSDFLVATKAADFIEVGDLELRYVDDSLHLSALLTENTIYTLLDMNGGIETVSSDDERHIADEVYKEYDDLWNRATEYSLRVPARQRLLDTIEEQVGESIATDFAAILDELDAVPRNEDIDDVGLVLLTAAKNEVLLYDVGRWGEDVGLASKATFSRTKTMLEEQGYLATEKVPLDVGRPRLRIVPGDELTATVDGLVSLVPHSE